MNALYRILYNSGSGWHVYLDKFYHDEYEAYEVVKELLRENPTWKIRLFSYKPFLLLDSDYQIDV